MKKHTLLMILILTLSLIFSSMGMAQEKILPSQFRGEVQNHLREKGVRSQAQLRTVLNAYLKANISRVKTTGLSVDETFLLAELYSILGDIDKTKAAVIKLAAGNDLNARKANQLIIAATIGSDKLVEAEKLIDSYSKKFPPTPDDLGHLGVAVSTLVDKYDAKGEPAKGVAVVNKVLATMPVDQPYMLYNYLAYMVDVFVKAGKKDEYVKLLEDLSAKFEAQAKKVEEDIKNRKPVRYANAGRSFKNLSRTYSSKIGQLKLIGSPAPDIPFNRFYNTEKISLADLKGKVVMIDFWANWCGPCKVAFPSMAKLYAKYKDKGFVILSVTSIQGRFFDGDISRPKLDTAEEYKLTEDFIKRHKMSWPVVFSSTSVFNPDYGVTGIPCFAVLDRKGNVQMVKTGAGEEAEKALHELVEKLVKE